MIRNQISKSIYIILMVGLCIGTWVYALCVPTRAAYRTSSGASTQVRVARFQMVIGDPELTSSDAILDCNDESDEVVFRIKIENRSEVKVAYSMEVTGMEEGLVCKITNGSGELQANGGETFALVQFVLLDRTNRS